MHPKKKILDSMGVSFDFFRNVNNRKEQVYVVILATTQTCITRPYTEPVIRFLNTLMSQYQRCLHMYILCFSDQV